MKSVRMSFVSIVVIFVLAVAGCSGNTAPKAATPAPSPKAPAAATQPPATATAPAQPEPAAQPTQAAATPALTAAATTQPGTAAPTQAQAASLAATTTVASTAQVPGAATSGPTAPAPATPAPAAGAAVTTTATAAAPTSAPVTGTVAAVAPPATPSATAPAGARTFNNPFVYCAAVGTIDQPDARYTGQAVPDSVVQGLMKALSATSEPSDTFRAGTVWRCMNHRVYACNFGANLPCSDKANASKTPSPAMVNFCQQNPNADNIPMAVTGHNVVFDWSCKNGAAVAGRQFAQVDPRGFVQDIWYPLNPPVAASGAASAAAGTAASDQAAATPPAATAPPAPAQPTPAAAPAATAAPVQAAAGDTYRDPFAFCAAVGTIDAPDARYTGELLPDSFVRQAMNAFGAPANAAVNDYKAGVFWRCADKKVLACFVGANLPCTEQANTDKTPAQAMTDFCKQNPSADNIPMVVTGHNTIYNWGCQNGAAVAGERFAEVDDQGFVKNIWYPVSPP